jgi:cell wall assembly regulator SMI1
MPIHKSKPPSYPVFDRVCTIFCPVQKHDATLACVKAVAPARKPSVRGGAAAWKAITLKDATGVLVLTRTRFVRGGFKGAPGAFNRVIVGASTFFRHVRVRPKQIREEVLRRISETNMLIGCVATPAFSADLGHYDVVFAIARATNGMIFDGQGMLDASGTLILDRSGRHGLRVWAPPGGEAPRAKVREGLPGHPRGKDVSARLSALWAEKRPGFEKRLRPGANAAALARFKKALGLEVPPELLALYAWHDGAKNPQTDRLETDGWLSLAGLLKFKKMLDTMGFEDEQTYPKYSWNPAWVPFLESDGDSVCIDTRSGVVFKRFNDTHVVLLAPSFAAWLAAHVAITEAIRVAPDEDPDGRFFDAFNGSIAERIRRRMSPGYPKRPPNAKSLF